MVALNICKHELRSLMNQKLATVSSNSITEQSECIFKSISKINQYQNAQRICVYLSMATGEVQTDAIIRDAFNRGKQVFVPCIPNVSMRKAPTTTSPRMEMVELLSLVDYESLKRDKWGIPSIDAKSLDQRESILRNPGKILDLIIVPGVAFQIDPITKFVRRLGRGKGYYDSFLLEYKANLLSKHRVSPNPSVPLYGLTLKEQYLSHDSGIEVPIEQHDYNLDGILIGDGRFYQAPNPPNQHTNEVGRD
ncbi:putative 5-formyltetrahydrofolate cyclo-ligase [Golovinomyces cichoracearum]|uniref:5-formyltetrahydrofolate cyclo-ligase n=1 Tax=Golovinomyces cichoracearum TaxID=62708 RepID=A0A420IUB2_9PEZI|nr:putative 5-formyltetrahydrofolate cyclo-ligase [Golovinomyces cichoracearum]